MQSFIFNKGAAACVLCLFFLTSYSQTPTEKLTVEKIMQDPKWIGTSPSDPYWSADGKYLFFK